MAGGRQYDQERFENLVLYLAERSADDLGYGKVKLNKLLFRSDFEAYRLLGASITGEEYKAQELGPVAAHLPSLLRRFATRGVMTIHEVPAGPYTREVPLVVEGHEANQGVFADEELAIVDRALEELRPHGAKSVSEWSHETSVGWRVKEAALRERGRAELIPYSSAPLSIRPLSERADAALRSRFARA